MGNNVQPSRSGKSFIRGTHIIAVLCFVLALGSGAARWWINSVRAQAEIPVLALNSLIRDVRTFHGLDGGFPADLAAVQDKVWTPRGKGGFTLSENNCSFVSANYYYLYHYAGPHDATFWAVPLGKYRNNFPSIYVKIRSAESEQTIWQGPALDYEQVKKINGAMQDVELINLSMKLQEAPQQKPPAQAAPGQNAPAQGPASPARTPPPNDSPFRFKMN